MKIRRAIVFSVEYDLCIIFLDHVTAVFADIGKHGEVYSFSGGLL